MILKVEVEADLIRNVEVEAEAEAPQEDIRCHGVCQTSPMTEATAEVEAEAPERRKKVGNK